MKTGKPRGKVNPTLKAFRRYACAVGRIAKALGDVPPAMWDKAVTDARDMRQSMDAEREKLGLED